MERTRIKRLRSYIKWALWVLLVQLILVNVSAAIYAYRFTHFYKGQPPVSTSNNFFSKTWKLFTGPKFYKLETTAAPGFPVEHITLATDNGLSIKGWYGATDSARGCVVLFHGVTVNKNYVLTEAAKFYQWGYNVLMVDFRGHGESEGMYTTFGVSETEEVQKAYEFAKSKGNQKIFLYGVSLGAVAILKAVPEKNLQPAGIIAEMPFDNLHNHFKSRATQVGFPRQPFAFLVTFWAGIENGYNGFRHSVVKYSKEVRCPVLLQWGEKDWLVSREHIEDVYVNIGAEKKKLVTYENADHESLLRADPMLWEKEVGEFLDGL